MTTDHFAEAEKLIASVMGSSPYVATAQEARDIVALAQVHATLATRQEPAGHPVTPYRQAYAELGEGVQALLDALDGGSSSYCRDLRARLRGLLGRPS